MLVYVMLCYYVFHIMMFLMHLIFVKHTILITDMLHTYRFQYDLHICHYKPL